MKMESRHHHKMFTLTMMTIMVFIIVITYHNMGSSILMVNASWQEAEGLRFYDERGDYKIRAISREDNTAVLEKFRALLGLRTFKNKVKRREYDESPAPSPSPNTIEAEAPAPAPVPAQAPAIHTRLHHLHHHHHHQSPRPRPML